MARESPLQSGFKSHSHKRRSVRFNGLWRVTQATSAPNRTHSGSQSETGAFRAGWYHYPRSVPHVSETLRGRGLKRQTLPLLGLGRGCSRRTQKAFGTAMRLCASLSRGVAAPLGCAYICRKYINFPSRILLP